jgi:hypothetical protein
MLMKAFLIEETVVYDGFPSIKHPFKWLLDL